MSSKFSEKEIQRFLTGLGGTSSEDGLDSTPLTEEIDQFARSTFEDRLKKSIPITGDIQSVSPPTEDEIQWPEQAIPRLREIHRSHPEVIREIALLTVRRERSIPWPLLIDILDILDSHRKNPSVTLYEQALGPVGRWVCSFHPEYYVFGPVNDKWIEGNTNERIAWMRSMRTQDIGRAVEQMKEWMEHHKAAFRHKILDLISTDPRPQDLSLLKKCTNDRSKKIRKRALLLRLRLGDPSLESGFSELISIKVEGLPRLKIDPEARKEFLTARDMTPDSKHTPNLFDLCRNAPPEWWIHHSWKACKTAIQSHDLHDRLMVQLAVAALHHQRDKLSIGAIHEVLLRCDADVLKPLRTGEFIDRLRPQIFKNLCKRWLEREEDITEHPLCLEWMSRSEVFWSEEMTKLFFYRIRSAMEYEMMESLEEQPFDRWLKAAALKSNPGMLGTIHEIMDEAFLSFDQKEQLEQMYELLEHRQSLRAVFAKVGKKR